MKGMIAANTLSPSDVNQLTQQVCQPAMAAADPTSAAVSHC